MGAEMCGEHESEWPAMGEPGGVSGRDSGAAGAYSRVDRVKGG
jgi:hypothetical protein